jgi:5-methyltetrahydrofolate--homocysteine methyltransferase
MKSLLDRVRNGEILVADGAIGTLLWDFGLKPGEPPESFCLTQPHILGKIAQEYLEAGADIIQTNTFGASPERLSLFGLEDRTEEINKNAVVEVKKVIGDRAFIAASCGPSGKLLKPYGDTEPGAIYDGFVRQMRAILEVGVDAISIETMTDLTEAKLAVKAAKTLSPATPVMASMTFDFTSKGFYTMMGVGIEEAVQGLEEAGADIVGSNCGSGIETMIEIGREFKRLTRLPVIIQSNAGLPVMQEEKHVWPETPEFMGNKAKVLISLGISIIGGCCGTTPEHIKAVRKAVDSLKPHFPEKKSL